MLTINRSQVQEADEIRHLDSEFDERENNFGEMKITLTGPSRNRKQNFLKGIFEIDVMQKGIEDLRDCMI